MCAQYSYGKHPVGLVSLGYCILQDVKWIISNDAHVGMAHSTGSDQSIKVYPCFETISNQQSSIHNYSTVRFV